MFDSPIEVLFASWYADYAFDRGGEAIASAALADLLEERGKGARAARVRAGLPATAAARAFLDDVADSWPFEAFEMTAQRGLSSEDVRLLRDFCTEEATVSDYAASEADVILHCLGHVATVRLGEQNQ